MIVAALVSSTLWVLCVAWFWVQGTFAEYYDCIFVYNRFYCGDIVQNLLDSFGPRHKRYMLSVALPCLLLPYFVGARLSPAQRTGWYGLAAWAIGCHIAVALTGRFVEYYFELWMPIYALVGGVLLAALTSGTFANASAWRWALPVMVLGPLAVRFAADLRYDAPPWLVYEPGGYEYSVRHVPRTAGLTLNRLLLPGERLYALGPPGQSMPLYFYTRKHPASGVIYEFPLYPGRPLAEKLDERIVRDLDRDPPDLIVLFKLSILPALEGKSTGMAPRLGNWITAHYSQCHLDIADRYICFGAGEVPWSSALPAARPQPRRFSFAENSELALGNRTNHEAPRSHS